VTAPTGATTTTQFDKDSNLNDQLAYKEQVTYTDGVSKTITTRSWFDGAGRVLRSGTGAGSAPVSYDAVATIYDSMGRVSKQSNPYVGNSSGTGTGLCPAGSPNQMCWTANSYDKRSRVTVVTLPDGQTVQTSYSTSAATVTVTDQVGRQRKSEVDGLGRLIKVTEQDTVTGLLSWDTSYSYDVLDNLTGVNQGNQTRSFAYDGLSRLTSQTTPEGGTVTFTYTSFDSVQTRTDARGAVTSYGYDSLNRLQTVTYNTSSAPGVATTSGVTINYRTSAPGKGQISSITDGLGSESYSYDSLARVSSKTRVIDTRSYQSQYQYNGANQLTLMIYPSGKRVRVNRDTRGRLSGLDKVDASNNVLLGYMSQVGYNTAGQVTGLNLGNGVAESFGYSNDRLQLTSQTATKGAATLMNLSYGYSASSGASGVGTAAGNSGQLMTITGTINSQTRNQAFTYDNVGRLTTATGWGAWQRRFAYDRWGNRTGMWNATTGGSQLQSIALQMSGSAPTNRIGNVNGVSYVYDSSGNVTNDGAYSYTYDAESRLVSVSVGGSGSYGYDSANRRIKKTASGVTTHYVWEGSEVIAEYDGVSGALISEYVHTGRVMIREQGSAIRYYHSDRLSTRLITDGTGTVVGTEDHLLFGEDGGVVGESEKHRFTSYERDSESGTDYAVNRQYSNGTGRFLRPDPVTGSRGNPQSFNRYAYAGNDPVNAIDPLGLQSYCFGYHVFLVDVNSKGDQVGPVRYAGFIPVFCVDIPDLEGAGGGSGTQLNKGPKAKFDYKRFLKCLKDIFGVSITGQGGLPEGFAFDRDSGGAFEGVTSTGFVTTSVNATRFSSERLGEFLAIVNHDPNGGPESGMVLRTNPKQGYIANDVAKDPKNTDIALLALFIHELGNSLGSQLKLKNPFSGYGAENKKYGISDPDIGAKFENCVFGNKGIVGLKSGRLGGSREL
jgi:RHS repeat-associated protein